MGYKVFADTNILIDLFDNHRVHSKSAKEIFEGMLLGHWTMYVSESVITTFDYIIASSLNKETRTNILRDLFAVFNILSCDKEVVLEALNSSFPDFEDVLLYELSFKNKMDYFITNDRIALKKLATKNLPVLSSKEFLDMTKK